MPECRYENFDIAVHGQAGPYLVHALYRGRSAEGELALDRTAEGWEQRLARLSSVRHPPGRAYLQETGSLLFHALWHGEVRDLWLHARSDIDRGAVGGLRVRLGLSPAAVAALPWEALYDDERGVVFAASRQTPLVRVVNLLRYVGTPRSLASRLPLRILAAVPEDPTGQVDAAEEWSRLRTVLAPLQPGGVHLVLKDGRFGPLDLRRAIEREQPDVLHIITHGRGDGILLWQDGEPQLVSAAALRLALEGATSLRLLLLAACATGQAVDASPLASLGAQLLQTGVPAVIAMQYDVRASASAAFSEHFYLELVAGRCAGQVDVAANFARSALYVQDSEHFAYGTPVLWLNAADGRIFMPERPFVLRNAPKPAEPALSASDVEILLAELAQCETWLSDVPQFERSAVPPALRSVEMGRQDNIQVVRDLLAALGAEPNRELRARGFAQQRAELGRRRERVDRLTGDLLAHLRGSAAGT